MTALVDWMDRSGGMNGEVLKEPMASPFRSPSHPLALAAAESLIGTLEAGRYSDLLDPDLGKMFGVLIVRDEGGRVGTLQAVSGSMKGQWEVPGLCPPLFDAASRRGFWESGGEAVNALDAQVQRRRQDQQAAKEELERVDSQLTRQRAALRLLHRERQTRRTELRTSSDAQGKLDEESRADKREWKRQRAEWAQRLDAAKAHLDAATQELATSRRAVAAASNALLARMQEEYAIPSFTGETTGLEQIFGGPAPGGAGDCAGPKLLAEAARQGLRPVAMAEVWFGPSPKEGGRRHGLYYPACRHKCGPLLPFMLRGVDVEPAPIYATEPQGRHRLIFEDEDLLVAIKPAGMLSIPGKGETHRDSLEERLAQQHEWVRLCHRLDRDTSGLIIAAKNLDSYRRVQQAFAERRVAKHYLAWVVGAPRGEGTIELPLGPNLDDRPRQQVAYDDGKPSTTHYRRLRTKDGFALMGLTPLTGRTHQLRVHAAHQEGLNCPIVGDRLYGQAAPRMLLHAESIRLVHPRSGEELRFHDPPDAGFWKLPTP